MFASKKAMEVLPNIHLLGMFIVTITSVYRVKALIPIYIYVLLDGLFGGFSLWWVPYIYIWAILWALTMLLPRDMYLWDREKHPAWLNGKLAPWFSMLIYALVSGLHGLLFGVLYAPFWAIVMHLSWQGMLAWIGNGVAFDLIHALSNFIVGFILAVPVARLLKRLS